MEASGKFCILSYRDLVKKVRAINMLKLLNLFITIIFPPHQKKGNLCGSRNRQQNIKSGVIHTGKQDAGTLSTSDVVHKNLGWGERGVPWL